MKRNNVHTGYDLDNLFTKYVQGTIDPGGLRQLEEWASLSATNREIFSLLKGESGLAGDLKKMYSYDQERVWKNIREAARAKEVKPRRRYRGLAATVATAAVIITGVILSLTLQPAAVPQHPGISTVIEPGVKGAVIELSDGRELDLATHVDSSIREADNTLITIDDGHLTVSGDWTSGADFPVVSTVRVPTGKEFTIELSDGTRVWLNSGSTITFPSWFAGNERSVEITGEAFLDVTRNEQMPFVVTSGQQRVTVLGTSFNINAYETESAIETTVISGRVRVEVAGHEVVLGRGMQSVFDTANNSIATREVYAEAYSSWTSGMFVFIDEPIEAILRKFERWYGVGFDTSDGRLAGIKYSGMLRRHDTFNEIASLMELTGELSFREDSGRIVVRLRGDI